MSVSAQNTNIQNLAGRHAYYYYSEPWLGDSTRVIHYSCAPAIGNSGGHFMPEWDGVWLYNTQIPLPLKGIAIVGEPRPTGDLSDCVLNLYSYDYIIDKRVLLSTTAPFNPHDSVGLYGINVERTMWGGPAYTDQIYYNLYEAMFDSVVTVNGPFLVGFSADNFLNDLIVYSAAQNMDVNSPEHYYEDSLHSLGRVYFDNDTYQSLRTSAGWRNMKGEPLCFPIIDTTGFTMPAVDSCKKPENIQMKEIVYRSIEEYPPFEDLPPYRDTAYSQYLEISWTPAPGSTATAVYCDGWHGDTLMVENHCNLGFDRVELGVGLEDWTWKYRLRSLGSGMGCSCSVSDSTEVIDYHWGMADTRDTITGVRYLYDTTQTDPVRIDEPQQENPLAELTYVMPNPAAGQVTIVSSFGLRSVDIYSMTGTLVMRQDLSGYAQQMDISALPSGTYLLVISTPAGQVTKKLMVQ